MREYIWLVPLLPFLGAFLNGVVLRNRLPKKAVGILALSAVSLACLVSVGAVSSYVWGSEEYENHEPYVKEL